jgi:hypothetical protein
MRTPTVAAVAALLLLCCVSAQAKIQEPDLRVDRVGWFKAQIQCAVKLAYMEAHNQDDEGQRLVVWVAAQRALERRAYWGGGSICKVAYHQWRNKKGELVSEFTGMHKPLDVSEDHPALRRAEWNARAVLLGGWQPEEKFRAARFYQNPAEADPSRSSWFDRALHKIGAAGDHVFYRERGPG